MSTKIWSLVLMAALAGAGTAQAQDGGTPATPSTGASAGGEKKTEGEKPAEGEKKPEGTPAAPGGQGGRGQGGQRGNMPAPPTVDEVLAAADKNKDGKLSKDEWFSWSYERMKAMPGFIERMAPRLDKDGDGQVSLEEFSAEPRQAERFTAADKDKSGDLDKAELEESLKRGGRGQGRGQGQGQGGGEGGRRGGRGQGGQGQGGGEGAPKPPAPPAPPAPPSGGSSGTPSQPL